MTFKNRWTVLKEIKKDGRKALLCACACGTKRVVKKYDVESGRSKSCGCIISEVTAKRNYKHGMADTLVFKVWQNLMQKCNYPENPAYKWYGARGIKVCKRWESSFENFYKDMGPKPSKKHSIGRINNDGNYEPGNCRWETVHQQANNKTTSRRIVINGKTQTLAQWCKELNIKYITAHMRLQRGWSEVKALTTPVIK